MLTVYSFFKYNNYVRIHLKEDFSSLFFLLITALLRCNSHSIKCLHYFLPATSEPFDVKIHDSLQSKWSLNVWSLIWKLRPPPPWTRSLPATVPKLTVAATLPLLPPVPQAPPWNRHYVLYTLWLSHQISLLSPWLCLVQSSALLSSHSTYSSWLQLSSLSVTLKPHPEYFYVETFSHQQPVIKHADSQLQGYPEISGAAFIAWRNTSPAQHLRHICSISGDQHHHLLSCPLQKPARHCRWTRGRKWCLI